MSRKLFKFIFRGKTQNILSFCFILIKNKVLCTIKSTRVSNSRSPPLCCWWTGSHPGIHFDQHLVHEGRGRTWALNPKCHCIKQARLSMVHRRGAWLSDHYKKGFGSPVFFILKQDKARHLKILLALWTPTDCTFKYFFLDILEYSNQTSKSKIQIFLRFQKMHSTCISHYHCIGYNVMKMHVRKQKKPRYHKNYSIQQKKSWDSELDLGASDSLL